MSAKLSQQYREEPVAFGLADNGQLLEVYATEDGATFSIVVTSSRGISCFVATGTEWHSVKKLLGQGS